MIFFNAFLLKFLLLNIYLLNYKTYYVADQAIVKAVSTVNRLPFAVGLNGFGQPTFPQPFLSHSPTRYTSNSNRRGYNVNKNKSNSKPRQHNNNNNINNKNRNQKPNNLHRNFNRNPSVRNSGHKHNQNNLKIIIVTPRPSINAKPKPQTINKTKVQPTNKPKPQPTNELSSTTAKPKLNNKPSSNAAKPHTSTTKMPVENKPTTELPEVLNTNISTSNYSPYNISSVKPLTQLSTPSTNSYPNLPENSDLQINNNQYPNWNIQTWNPNDMGHTQVSNSNIGHQGNSGTLPINNPQIPNWNVQSPNLNFPETNTGNIMPFPQPTPLPHWVSNQGDLVSEPAKNPLFKPVPQISNYDSLLPSQPIKQEPTTPLSSVTSSVSRPETILPEKLQPGTITNPAKNVDDPTFLIDIRSL